MLLNKTQPLSPQITSSLGQQLFKSYKTYPSLYFLYLELACSIFIWRLRMAISGALPIKISRYHALVM
jgi:hypothetical protein